MSAILEKFNQYSTLPPQPELLEKWKDGGKKIIGWACNYLPEEIIHAAGMMPYRVSGGVGEIKMEAADSVLHIYSCSYTRTCLQRLISGDYDFLDGFLNCGTCDGMRRLGDAWESKSVDAKIPLPYSICVPHKFHEKAEKLYADEFTKLRGILEKEYDCSITDEALAESITLYNYTRILMKRLYDLRKSDTPPVSGYEVQEVLNAAVAMPREEFNPLLEDFLREIEKRPGIDGDRPRLMINGSIMNNPGFIKGIEDLGANLVVDSLCNGARYFWGEVDLESFDNPIDALASYYLQKLPCPRVAPPEKRFEFINSLVKEFRVEGVISEIVRYCSIHIYDEPRVKARLEDIGVPALTLEKEYTEDISGQVKTRVQAFIEMLRERRAE
ncbi:MAG: 2-hydroxyacyl-CoA dehydratase [Deltaproteobacteria bacterium]|nr:2-hydroxyacyl-CoA dehydratase [Deltaproteobacteria bacterium]